MKEDLIPSEISQKILWAIQKNYPIDPQYLPPNLTIEAIENLRRRYLQKKQELNLVSEFPRNKIFYSLIQEKISFFDWEIFSQAGRKNSVLLKIPRIKQKNLSLSTLNPSLLTLLLRDIPYDELANPLYQRYDCVKSLPKHLVLELSKLMEKIQIVYPDEKGMTKIVRWIEKGFEGEPLTLFMPTCPDYSVEETKDPKYPYQYTFNELGSGLGLVAKRLIEALPTIDLLLKKYGIQISYVLAMGDFEALVEDNLNRLRLSFEEFITRLEKSRKVFTDVSSIPIKTPMITELCGGYESWIKLCGHFKERLQNNDFGQSDITQEAFIDIIKTRKPLYDRWLGVRPRLEDYLAQLLNQGAEYATIGAIVARQYQNCLILCADHATMGVFYNIEKCIPTLYLQRLYR